MNDELREAMETTIRDLMIERERLITVANAAEYLCSYIGNRREGEMLEKLREALKQLPAELLV